MIEPEFGHRYTRQEMRSIIAPGNRPSDVQMDVKDVRMEAGRPLPARESRNKKIRWCLCCDTRLPDNPQSSPLCEPHRRLHRSQRRQRNTRPGAYLIERRYLEEAHDLLDQIETEIGRLVVAYAAGRDPRSQLRRTRDVAADFITKFRERFPRP